MSELDFGEQILIELQRDEVSPEMKMALAQQLLPLDQNDLLKILFILCGDSDGSTAIAAQRSLHELPESAFVNMAEAQQTAPALLHSLARTKLDSFEVMRRLYAPFNRQKGRIQRTSPKTAEIVKYAANALLATKISFMNEMARLCDVAGGDVEDVRIALGTDSRIGMQFLYPGLGFGGSCFPKDLRALVNTGNELGVALRVAEAAVAANSIPVKALVGNMDSDLGGLDGKIVAVWGLAFKPATDDVREAPALRLIGELRQRGATVRATDPEARQTAMARLEGMGALDAVTMCDNEYQACEGAHCLVIATEWNEYRSPDLKRIAGLMQGKWVFDGRNILVPESVVDAGLHYRGMGRPAMHPR